MKQSNNQKKINLPLIIATALVSILLWALVPYIHDFLIDIMAAPLALGIIFALFLAVISATVLLISSMTHAFRADILTGRTEKPESPCTFWWVR